MSGPALIRLVCPDGCPVEVGAPKGSVAYHKCRKDGKVDKPLVAAKTKRGGR